RLSEVLAHHDVGGELGPLLGDLGIGHLEDDRAIGIGDAAGALLVLDGGEGVLSLVSELAGDLHCTTILPWVCWSRIIGTSERVVWRLNKRESLRGRAGDARGGR